MNFLIIFPPKKWNIFINNNFKIQLKKLKNTSTILGDNEYILKTKAYCYPYNKNQSAMSTKTFLLSLGLAVIIIEFYLSKVVS